LLARNQLVLADRAAAPTLQSFNFAALPVCIASDILVLATGTSSYWGTYRSLTLVSRATQRLVYQACLPHLPIMLHLRAHVASFCSLLQSHGTLVTSRIRALWFVASIKASEEREYGLAILRACTHLTHLACNLPLLKAFVGSQTCFAHPQLKNLTLIETIVPWNVLLSTDVGRRLFAQLTHFRASGGTSFSFPSFRFASLTHLSYAVHDLDAPAGRDPFSVAQFPALRCIVPTITYWRGRSEDGDKMRQEGLGIDSRMHVLLCPKKWKEANAWEGERRGEIGLWGRGDGARRSLDV
jgi:hypothetical protein